ncbi:MAG: outer membrane beta-barrel protein [Vibrio gallaecicus]|uniref:Outer membrane beta-barrel protein n=1 Tax=Vibrio gallaecicus TaxID=552386 RepID=A0ABV4NEB1_9VIBR|nr:outer membrane beta-barrel protein [Vibrio gallaecicus]MDN3614554.1 outer membrane beta-barrel protein [Vibrio gallaecicus]
MNTKANIVALLALFSVSNLYAAPNVIITPLVGYTGGGGVEDEDGNSYDMEGSESFTFAIETPLDKGRIGLFYSNQQSQLETLNIDSSIQYLHFQSSIYYPANEKLSSYLGLGLGVSYVDVDWAKDKYGFSTSVFGGFEYKLGDNIALNSQLRWLGTVVDNDTSGACTLPTTGQSCIIKFDTDWMNQFQASLGLTFYF